MTTTPTPTAGPDHRVPGDDRTDAPRPRHRTMAWARLTATLVLALSLLGVSAGAPSQAAGALEITVTPSCECGGYPFGWGFNVLAVVAEDSTPVTGHRYRLTTVPATTTVTSDKVARGTDSVYEVLSLPARSVTAGKRYRIIVEELEGRRVVESAETSYILPAYVGHPKRMSINNGRGKNTRFVAGKTYRLSASSPWEKGTRYRYAVWANNFERDDYEVEYAGFRAVRNPLTTFTIPRDFVGETVNVLLVGSKKGRLEWGYSFSARVVAR